MYYIKNEGEMAQYIVRKGKFTHEVAKFEESNIPTGVYRLTDSRCDCPARTSSCKHRRILKAWKDNGNVVGAILSDEATVIGNLFGDTKWK